MTLSTVSAVLLLIQHLTTIAFAASAASNCAPSPSDIVSPLVALGNLVEPIQDPQQVKTWVIDKGDVRAEDINEQQRIFEGHYDKKLLPLADVIKTDAQIAAPWNRLSIWRQQLGDVQGSNYLLSYNRDDKPGNTLWVIGNRGRVLWHRETRCAPHDSGPEFPVLKYTVTLEYDTFCKLHGMYKALLEADKFITCSDSNCQVAYQKLVIENDALRSEKQDLKQKALDFGSELQTLKVKQESWQKLVDQVRKEEKDAVDTNRDPTVQEQENEALQRKIRDLEIHLIQASKSIENWRHNHTILVQEHHKAMEEMIDRKELWPLIVRWCCIVGAVTLLITALVMCVGFRYYYSNQKKQWEIQRLQALVSANNVYQRVEEINIKSHRRPRTYSLDELHHKFGMNEIDKVTAKEGGDLVRIARPLETDGAERKLSEELFGIGPIISDRNARTKQMNETISNTRTEGEEEDGLRPRLVFLPMAQ